MNRTVLIAGNWKMNKTPQQSEQLIEEIKALVAGAACEVVVCPPFVCLPTVCAHANGSNLSVGAQNCHAAPSGAYTGEVALPMLQELGVSYVIIGHSERRQYFAETDQTVNEKLKAILAAGLKAIVCVGESLQQRQQGVTNSFVAEQVTAALQGVSEQDLARLAIAYEPIWAIGTGLAATAEQADEVCGLIRATVGALYSEQAARAIVVQYGGSMNAANAQELLSMPNIDGGLIGGASLKAADFAAIVAQGSRRAREE